MWSVILSIIRKLSLFILLSIILKPPRLERYGNTFFSTNVYWAFEKEKNKLVSVKGNRQFFLQMRINFARP